MKVHYAHLCEKAFLSQNGNLNLIGIFERIFSQKFPVVFPQLSIVTSLEGEVGDHKMTIKIDDPKSGEEIIKPITLNINVKAPAEGVAEKPQNLRIIGDINNLNFKSAGEYEVKILLNDEIAYSIPFSVQQAIKPIPENR